MPISKAVAVLTICLLTGPALADSLSNRRAEDVKVFRFGNTVIRQTYDSRRDPGSPDITFQVYDGAQLKVQLKDAEFDQFFPSPDNDLFVGLSNGGWPGSAVIVFDKEGHIFLLSDHLTAKFDYCFTTSTFARQWYDQKDTQVHFPAGHAYTRIYGITLKSCKGRTIGLVEAVNGAADRNYRSVQDFDKPALKSR